MQILGTFWRSSCLLFSKALWAKSASLCTVVYPSFSNPYSSWPLGFCDLNVLAYNPSLFSLHLNRTCSPEVTLVPTFSCGSYAAYFMCMSYSFPAPHMPFIVCDNTDWEFMYHECMVYHGEKIKVPRKSRSFRAEQHSCQSSPSFSNLSWMIEEGIKGYLVAWTFSSSLSLTTSDSVWLTMSGHLRKLYSSDVNLSVLYSHWGLAGTCVPV